MNGLLRVAEGLASFKRIPLKVVIITALMSYVLQIGMIVEGQPLYIIALATLLPWGPVLMFEGLWKVKHYHWIAAFAIIVVLQLGHLGEHLLQVGALEFSNATLACPPPADNAVNAQRAMDAGLRMPDDFPTGIWSSKVIAPNAEGFGRTDAGGEPVIGIPACGVFGQLDLEIVHLIWDGIGWILTLILLSNYPRDRWLWLAMVWSSVHTVEHLFISYTFFLDSTLAFEGTKQLWGTVVDGNIVTGIPLGKENLIVNFYQIAGKFGIFGRNGLVGSLIPGLNSTLPTRPNLHLFYNTMIVIPTCIAFIREIRHTYDHYLAKALPGLTEKELVEATPMLETQHFKPGEIIIKQGDPADAFYVISGGTVEVVHEGPGNTEQIITTLEAGQYFGEMGILDGAARIATVRAAQAVEVMRMSASMFQHLLATSETSRRDMARIVAERHNEVVAFE